MLTVEKFREFNFNLKNVYLHDVMKFIYEIRRTFIPNDILCDQTTDSIVDALEV